MLLSPYFMKFDSRLNMCLDLFLTDLVVWNLASETEGHRVIASYFITVLEANVDVLNWEKKKTWEKKKKLGGLI